jgi:hypothetical protein
MPYITQRVDIDIDIDVEDFVNDCNSKEIKELIKYLREKGHLDGEMLTDNMSILDKEWAEVISKIGVLGRLQLTNKEEETIRKIANRL